MPRQENPLVSSHRDAATRVRQYLQEQHQISLKPTAALEVVARVLGAANWQTLLAMAEQGKAPRVGDASAALPASLSAPMASAAQLALLTIDTKANPCRDMVRPEEEFLRHIAALEQERNLRLTDEQRGTLVHLAREPLGLLTGPSGTGKTLAAQCFAQLLRQLGVPVSDATGASGVADVLAAWARTRPQRSISGHLLLLDDESLANMPLLAELLTQAPVGLRVLLTVDSDRDQTAAARSLVDGLLKRPRVWAASFLYRLRQPA